MELLESVPSDLAADTRHLPSEPRARSLWLAVHEVIASTPDEPHVVPSASGVWGCTRQAVYRGRNIPRTNSIPVRSRKKMQSGVAIEDFWLDVYSQVLAGVDKTPPPIPKEAGIPYVPGEADGLTAGAVLELKDLGVWSYIKFVQEGLKAAEMDYWYQVQCYMAGYGQPTAIVHAGMADSSATMWIWQRIKRLPGLPPDFWIEVVDFNDGDYRSALTRAREIAYYIDDKPDTPINLVPRNWRGNMVEPTELHSQRKMPCFYCGWYEQCVADG